MRKSPDHQPASASRPAADPVAWGVLPESDGRAVPRDVQRAVLAAMSAGAEGPPPVGDLRFHRAGRPLDLGGAWTLRAEDGTEVRFVGQLDAPPSGYHWLAGEGGRRVRLIVAPERCHAPPPRTWGWSVVAHALRSRTSWGHGDLADLRTFAACTASTGGGALVVGPLHARTPVTPVARDPAFPSSRCFLDPLYLRIEEVPRADVLGSRLAPLAEAGRALNFEDAIDHDAVLRLKLGALEEIWTRTTGDAGFREMRAARGETLNRFATFCAIAEKLGPRWTSWPERLRGPDSPSVWRFAAEYETRVRFFTWVQWLLDVQLGAAAKEVPLVVTLAAGVDPGGADAWMWQDCYLGGASIGAAGDDWCMPALDPWRLRQAHYEPFIQTVRAAFRHAGGLRIDHVAGLFRQYWIPRGASEGAYVRSPAEELLDIIAIESQRARAWVCGDGPVDERMARALEARGVTPLSAVVEAAPLAEAVCDGVRFLDEIERDPNVQRRAANSRER